MKKSFINKEVDAYVKEKREKRDGVPEKLLEDFTNYVIRSKNDQLRSKNDQLRFKDDQLRFKDDQLRFKDDQLRSINEEIDSLKKRQNNKAKMVFFSFRLIFIFH